MNDSEVIVVAAGPAEMMLASLLGPSLTLKLATTLVRVGARSSIRSKLFTRAVDRVLWGYPEVRADAAPWQAT